MPKYYDWEKTMSYQTGTNGEICLVLGAKDIGKTFGLRKKCVERFIKTGELFCEICRTNAERDEVLAGYFDKLQYEGFFADYVFKIEKKCGFIALKPATDDDKPQWRLICYFVALTNFQREKKRTYKHVKRFIFDEAIIDTKDRYHRYLKDEFLILANLLDSISRQQPDGTQYYVYLLGNAVDLTCPYIRYNGIKKLPSFGYSWFKDKTVLLHYVEPWDADERRARTLVGRMLAGHDESKVIFDNVFEDTTGREIMRKTSEAKYRFSFVWSKMIFAIWIDSGRGLWFITSKKPKGAKNVYTLAKKDSSIDYQALKRADPLAKLLSEIYYIGGLRYESAHLREAFFEILEFLGIR